MEVDGVELGLFEGQLGSPNMEFVPGAPVSCGEAHVEGGVVGCEQDLHELGMQSKA
jgi:hypothetical protein